LSGVIFGGLNLEEHSMIDFHGASQQFQGEFDALRFEVHTLAEVFQDENFYDDPWKFRHAHYGYLMVCMGWVDRYSTFWKGSVRSSKTQRMIDFLSTFVYPLPEHNLVHSVVVQIFRHGLMHTGDLRFTVDRRKGVGYTWRVQFGRLPEGADHYSIMAVVPKYRERFLRMPLPENCNLKELRAINISIPLFVTGLYQGVSRYMHQVRESDVLQENYLTAEAAMIVQTFHHRLPTASLAQR
jgi:hypothetical protein